MEEIYLLQSCVAGPKCLRFRRRISEQFSRIAGKMMSGPALLSGSNKLMTQRIDLLLKSLLISDSLSAWFISGYVEST